MRVALAVLTCIAAAASAWAQTSQQRLHVQIGKTDVELFVPEGQCLLDRGQQRDRATLEVIERILKGQNELKMYSADCSQLPDWRTGKRAFLSDYWQVQSNIAYHNEDLRGREKQAIAETCADLRKAGEQYMVSADKEVNQRIAEGREAVGLKGMQFLGVLGEDDFGCYAGLMVKATLGSATTTFLNVYSTSVLKGKLVYIYRYSDRLDAGEVEHMIDLVRATAKQMTEINKSSL